MFEDSIIERRDADDQAGRASRLRITGERAAYEEKRAHLRKLREYSGKDARG